MGRKKKYIEMFSSFTEPFNYKMRKYTRKYFRSFLSLQYLLWVSASYRLTIGRMTCVRQQNYRPTSTDVTEWAVV